MARSAEDKAVEREARNAISRRADEEGLSSTFRWKAPEKDDEDDED